MRANADRRRIRLRYAAVIGAVLLLLGFWLWLRYLMWEPSGIERGSVVYWMKVPRSIRALGLWRAKGPAQYDVRVGDGSAPGYVRIHYRASGGVRPLQDAIVKDGYVCERNGAVELSCERRFDDASYRQVYGRYDWESDTTIVRFEVPNL